VWKLLSCTPASTRWHGASAVAEELSKFGPIAGRQICRAGMALHAGHGLNLSQCRARGRASRHMHELNIAHSIIARALMVGLQSARARNEGSHEPAVQASCRCDPGRPFAILASRAL